MSGILNTIPDNLLENTVISICRDSGVEIDPAKGYRGLYVTGSHSQEIAEGKIKQWLSNLSTGSTRKPYFETKKNSSSKSFNNLNVPNKVFVSVSLCPLHYGLNSGRVNFFCLGSVVCIKLSENGSQIKLYHMNDNPDFPSESNVEN